MRDMVQCKKYECPCEQTIGDGKGGGFLEPKKRKIRAIDFDGTLFENKWPGIGEPNLELIKYLINCRLHGDKLILWTCRSGEHLIDAVCACHKVGLQFDAINENLPETLEWAGSDSRKIYADVYYDDRAARDFQLPFVSIKITYDVISRIEEIFGFELYPWQLDYLIGDDSGFELAGKGTGRTFVYCIRLLLENREPFDLSNWDHIRMLSDDNEHGPTYYIYFKQYISDLDIKLQRNGLRTNNRPSTYGRDVI